MKLKWKKVLRDPGFWLLLGVNVFLIYEYEIKPSLFITLLFIYWSQSVLPGLFNFVDMLTSKRVDVSHFADGDKIKNARAFTIRTAFFFLFHYGFFHIAYFIFICVKKGASPIDWGIYQKVIIIFIILQLFTFIQHKVQNKKVSADIGKMMAMPYLRIIPMHLCILIPAFLNITAYTVFLVLKVLCDMIAYAVTTNYSTKNDTAANMTAINMDSTL